MSPLDARAARQNERINLLARVREGEAEAWEILVREYSPLVYGTAVRTGLFPEDAADVAQSVWIVLLEKSDQIRDPVAIPRWLAVTARRIALKRLRKLTPHPVQLPDDLRSREISAEDLLEEERRSAEVRAALDLLEPDCRLLLENLFLEERPSYVDVAEATGKPVGSIGPTRARCLAKLYRILSRSGFASGGPFSRRRE